MARREEEIGALEARLNSYPLVVTYTPLPEEVAFSAFLALEAPRYPLPPSPSLDPFEAAKQLAARAGGKDACVLLPGRAFDARGTRTGRGGGWYDRFLSAIPASWLRIGFCTAERFSEIPLPRQEWDQPVDLLVIAGPEAEDLRLIETGARPGAIPDGLLG